MKEVLFFSGINGVVLGVCGITIHQWEFWVLVIWFAVAITFVKEA